MIAVLWMDAIPLESPRAIIQERDKVGMEVLEG